MLGQSAHLWTRTSLPPADVDLALVYDGFTFNAISWLEALGFCGIGEAKDWIDGGRRIALDGELPSTRTAASCPRDAPTASGSSTRRSPSSATRPASARCADARTAVVTSGGGTPSGVLLLQRDGT